MHHCTASLRVEEFRLARSSKSNSFNTLWRAVSLVSPKSTSESARDSSGQYCGKVAEEMSRTRKKEKANSQRLWR